MATTLFSKIVKGILIGGGSILSLLSPALGGAVISRGMAIGQGLIAGGSLINPSGNNTIDQVVSNTQNRLGAWGLLDPAPNTPTTSGSSTGFVLSMPLIIVIVGLFLVLIFKRR